MAYDVANIFKVVAAASATVGTDLLAVSPAVADARVPYARIMDGFALVGSTAAGDTIVDLKVNGRRVGTYANSATGVAVDKERDLIPLDLFVPANALIEVVVTDAAASNPVLCQIEFHKPSRTGGTRRRYSGSRRSYGTRRSTRRVSGGMY